MKLPAVIAHRGANADAPENTLPAFQFALAQNCDGIELDAQLTADGQVVVIHDDSLNRTTDGQGAVRKSGLADLKTLDAGSWFKPEFKGTRVPTLAEALALIGDRALTNIELKNLASPLDRLPGKAAAVIKDLKLEGHVMISSFNPLALAAFKRALPDVPAGLLTVPGRGGTITRLLAGALIRYRNLHPHYSAVSPQLLAGARRKGQGVYTYTVNQADEMKRLYALGITGIITDDPSLALSLRGGMPV